ncbi:hypothetical protein ADK55_18515 [Streptomyces sp. WM4235]|uniref:DNA cytosine methyltransferase n=1 Tax=Streptomyces sp. WM4235 TaxID=1415551 RepID=UPI0006B05F14|nr:DNA cytosine methyltransferase [Streptomyces sp. WM4235]KOU50541.1 hypothetical protein ADK55_18515 [Streptomyces sp. WM4235]
MTNLSLCSGFGGLDLAVEQITGNKTTVYAENDRFAAQVMAARFPWATNLGDITTTDWADLAAQYEFDTISAGFPCQDISNAGKRKGITGARSGIWKQVVEAVRHTRPRLVFLENVEAIRSRGLDVVVADLASIGYDARWTGVPARDVGAPHLRWRWFCVAYPTATDPERGGRYRWPRDIAEAEGRTEPADGRHQAAGADERVKLLPTPSAGNFNDGEALESWMARRDRLKAKGVNGNGMGTPLSIAVQLLPTPKASDGPNGGPNQRDTKGNYYLPGIAVRLDRDWVTVDGVDYGPAIRRWEAILGRPAPEPTEPGQRGNRRITARFVEWVMGADAGWITDLDIPRAQQIKIGGNGVVTRQAVEGYRRLLVPDLAAMAAA